MTKGHPRVSNKHLGKISYKLLPSTSLKEEDFDGLELCNIGGETVEDQNEAVNPKNMTRKAQREKSTFTKVLKQHDSEKNIGLRK
jgi:hypothetical protein